jgi:hypothetical protein
MLHNLAKNAYEYAKDINRGPWPPGESVISLDAQYSYLYAKNVLHGPFIMGEKAIKTNPMLCNMYNNTIKPINLSNRYPDKQIVYLSLFHTFNLIMSYNNNEPNETIKNGYDAMKLTKLNNMVDYVYRDIEYPSLVIRIFEKKTTFWGSSQEIVSTLIRFIYLHEQEHGQLRYCRHIYNASKMEEYKKIIEEIVLL